MKLCDKHEKAFSDMVNKACFKKNADPKNIIELNDMVDTFISSAFEEVLNITKNLSGIHRLAVIKMLHRSNLYAVTDMHESKVTRETALSMVTAFANMAIEFVYDHEPSNASLKEEAKDATT